MTNSSSFIDYVLIRAVELTATYLVHSTLIFVVAAAVAASLRRKALPAVTERIWIVCLALPMVTAPLSVFVGSSSSVWNWSLTTDAELTRDLEPVLETIQSSSPTPLTGRPSTEIIQEPDNLISADATNSMVATEDGPGAASNRAPFESLMDTIRRHRDSLPQVEMKSSRVSSFQPESNTDNCDLAMEEVPSVETPTPARHAIVDHQKSGFERVSILSVCGMAIFTWLICSVAFLVWKSFSLTLLLRHLSPIEGRLARELDRILPSKAKSRIRLLRMESSFNISRHRRSASDEPFACGLWRWTIVLPEGIEDWLSAEELHGLLAHEVAHLVRRDPWLQWLGQVACTCLAFQPLNFIARRRWQLAAELLCDDWAVTRNVAPTTLATCLTRVAEWRLERTGGRLNAAGIGLSAVGTSGLLTQRIHWLLRSGRACERPRSYFPTVLMTTTFVAGLFLGMYGPRLALTSAAHAASDGEDQASDVTWQLIEQELSLTRQDLARLQSQLNADSDSESSARIDRLLKRMTSLMEEFDD